VTFAITNIRAIDISIIIIKVACTVLGLGILASKADHNSNALIAINELLVKNRGELFITKLWRKIQLFFRIFAHFALLFL